MADNTITLVGNITDDPELRFTPTGRPVANFTVAVNRRYKGADGQWEDKLDGFFRCNCWADLAEHVAESLQKGTRVVVTGRLQQRSWEDQEGNRRSAIEVQVDEIGPSLRWATASVQKTTRSSAQGRPREATQQQPAGGDEWSSQTESPQPASQQPASGGDWGPPASIGSQSQSEEGRI